MADITFQNPEFTPAVAAEFRRRNLHPSSLAGLPSRRRVEVLSSAQITARQWPPPSTVIVEIPRLHLVRFSHPAYSPDGHTAVVYWQPGDRGELLFLACRDGVCKITKRELVWIA